MYVSKVELKSIRGVGAKGLALDLGRPAARERGTLAGWNVLVSPNGAGKTTLLQAAAASIVGGGGSAWLLRPEERRDWIHREGAVAALKDSGTTCVWVEGVPGDDLPLPEQAAGPAPLRIRWSRDPSAVQEVTPRGKHHADVLSQFWDAAAFGAPAQGWLFAGYGPHRANRQSSPDAASLFRAAPRTAAVVTLFRQDAGLEAGSQWAVGLEMAARGGAHAAEEVLRDGILRLLGDGLLVEGTSTPIRIEAEGLEVFWNEGWRPLHLLGDGNYSVVALVLDLLLRVHQFMPHRLLENMSSWSSEGEASVDVSGTVVIDEPENHLHPALQQRLGFWLKQHFPALQFVVATHSPLICQAADRGGLFCMPTCGKVLPLDMEVWAQVANGTVDDAITSRLFGLESPQSASATIARRRLGELQSRRLRADLGAQEEAERRALLEQLPQGSFLPA
jgi:hypothetical protein